MELVCRVAWRSYDKHLDGCKRHAHFWMFTLLRFSLLFFRHGFRIYLITFTRFGLGKEDTCASENRRNNLVKNIITEKGRITFDLMIIIFQTCYFLEIDVSWPKARGLKIALFFCTSSNLSVRHMKYRWSNEPHLKSRRCSENSCLSFHSIDAFSACQSVWFACFTWKNCHLIKRNRSFNEDLPLLKLRVEDPNYI